MITPGFQIKGWQLAACIALLIFLGCSRQTQSTGNCHTAAVQCDHPRFTAAKLIINQCFTALGRQDESMVHPDILENCCGFGDTRLEFKWERDAIRKCFWKECMKKEKELIQ